MASGKDASNVVNNLIHTDHYEYGSCPIGSYNKAQGELGRLLKEIIGPEGVDEDD